MLWCLSLSSGDLSPCANHHLPLKCQFGLLVLSDTGEKTICCDKSVVHNFSWGAFQNVKCNVLLTCPQFQEISPMFMLSSCLLSSWGLETLPPLCLRTLVWACQTLVHSQPGFAWVPHSLQPYPAAAADAKASLPKATSSGHTAVLVSSLRWYLGSWPCLLCTELSLLSSWLSDLSFVPSVSHLLLV